MDSGHPDDHRAMSVSSNYPTTESAHRLPSSSLPPPPPLTSARPFVQHQQPIHQDDIQPFVNFLSK